MNSNSFLKGMSQDTTPKFTPEGYYRFALNAVNESTTGDNLSIVTEASNYLSVQAPDMTLIGHCLLSDHTVALFYTDNITSEISIYDPIGATLVEQVVSTCLNFNTAKPIQCLLSVKKGCERTIYFTDNYNPYRVINLDNLQSYLPNGTSPTMANSFDSWDCALFRLTKEYIQPEIQLLSVNDSGGANRVGTVQFSIQLLDESLNETNWMYVTNTIPIYDENIGASYSQITGGYAIPVGAVDVPEGAVPITTKSITLQINDLDTRFKYYRLAALHASSGAGAISEVYVLETLPITSTSTTFTYRGPTLHDSTSIALPDIQIDNETIGRVVTHAITNNTLFLGGITSIEADYAAMQRAASKILTKFTYTTVDVTDQSTPGDPKNPNTYFSYRTPMPDEIYDLAIEFIMTGGTVSPAFHIPGRAKILPSDFDTVTGDETLHLGGGEQPLWKALNNAEFDNFPDGYMGYNEAESVTYPDIRCNDESVWGQDYWGNDLVGMKVRHHRIPSRRLVRINDGIPSSIRIIGFKFDNIVYPSSDIVGHRFLISKRDENSKTVLDNGFLAQLHLTQENGSGPTYYGVDALTESGLLYGTSSKAMAFISPKTLLQKEQFNGTHITAHSLWDRNTFTSLEDYVDDGNPYDAMGFAVPNIEIACNVHKYAGLYGSGAVTEAINSPYDAQVYVDPYSTQEAVFGLDHGVVNTSFTTPLPVIQLSSRYLPDTFEDQTLYSVSIKSHKEVYTSLEAITYVPLHNNVLTPTDDQTIFGGDCFVTYLNYASVYQFKYSLTGGNIPPLPIPSPALPFQILTFILANQESRYSAEYISGIWVDSELNFALRHQGQDECNQIYLDGYLSAYFINKIASKIIKEDFDNGTVKAKYKPRDFMCQEYYAYNMDFSKTNTEKPNFPLPNTFNYCSNCLTSNPYRIRSSENAYQEQVSDSFRVFKPNNYVDLDASTGPLTALRTYSDNLYAMCKKTSYFVPTRPQQIQTNDDSVYLGTGTVLSIPPKKLVSTSSPYGGTSHQLSTLSTEFGITLVDSSSSKVFLITDSLKEISNAGMRNFFENEGHLYINDSFIQATGEEYPLVDAPTDSFGAGFLSYYDPRHRRLIITKKDFLPLFEYTQLEGTPVNGYHYWDPVSQQFVFSSRNSVLDVLDINNPVKFEDKSFTISYSFLTQSWLSFHSYVPTYAFNDENRFYTTPKGSVYRHDSTSDWLNYYGTYYDHILEFAVFPGPFTSYYDSLIIISDTLKHNPTNRSFSNVVDKTFDRAWLYNSYQSTGPQTLTILSNPFSITANSPTSIPIKRIDSAWRMNDMRDQVINRSVPVDSSEWVDIQSNYYIDKVPNPDATSATKSLFQVERLKDDYLLTRLYFKGQPTYKIRTDLVHTNNKPSFR